LSDEGYDVRTSGNAEDVLALLRTFRPRLIMNDQKALAAGCDDYITKPISTVSLPALVARHLVAGA
jgi:hypothetical protein